MAGEMEMTDAQLNEAEITRLDSELSKPENITNSKVFNNANKRKIFLTAKENGLSDKEACVYSGIAESTLTNWKGKAKMYLEYERDENKPYYLFCEQIKHAELNLKELSLKTIKHAVSVEKDAKTAAWYLERKYKDEFGKEDASKNQMPSMNVKIEKVYINREEKKSTGEIMDAEIIEENGEG